MTDFTDNSSGNYTETYPPNANFNPLDKVMSVKDWVITMLISAIPLVGFIMILVWAFGSGHNTNKSNYAKAVLIFAVIMIVVYLVFFSFIFGLLFSSDELKELIQQP